MALTFSPSSCGTGRRVCWFTLTLPDRLMQVIRQELLEVRERYADARRTEIIAAQQDLMMRDLIGEEDMVTGQSPGRDHADHQRRQPGAHPR